MKINALIETFNRRGASEEDSRAAEVYHFAADELKKLAATLGPRLCVSAIITDEEDRLLLVRHQVRGWELPGGKVELGEGWLDALRREVLAESGQRATILETAVLVVDGLPVHGARYHSAIIVARGSASGELKPVAGDAVVEAAWFARGQIPREELSEIATRALVLEWEAQPRGPSEDAVDASIALLREAFRDDGAEGESVHVVCREVERLRVEMRLGARSQRNPVLERARSHFRSLKDSIESGCPVDIALDIANLGEALGVPEDVAEAHRIREAFLTDERALEVAYQVWTETRHFGVCGDLIGNIAAALQRAAAGEYGEAQPAQLTGWHPEVDAAIDGVCAAAHGIGPSPFERAVTRLLGMLAKHRPAPPPDLDREGLGRIVRDVWIAWAREQPSPKASWLAPWDALSEPDREVDRRIGERLFAIGHEAASSRPAPLTEEEQRMVEIGRALHAQDNRATDAPIFIVQEKRRRYGLDTEYADDHEIVWVSSEGDEADAETRAELEAAWDETDDEPEGWTRTACVDEWHFVTACFTEAGCQEYIRVNGHNLKEPRIYAAGSWRNEEWRAVRDFLTKRARATPPEVRREEEIKDAAARVAIATRDDAWRVESAIRSVMASPEPRVPVFPQRVCRRGPDGACGFEIRGGHWECVDGEACGRKVHPGEDGYAELEAYYRATRSVPGPSLAELALAAQADLPQVLTAHKAMKVKAPKGD